MPRRKLHPPSCWPGGGEGGGGGGTSCLPKRWPNMTGPLAWDRRNLDPNEITYHFTSADVKEIDRALEAFKSMDLDGPEINVGKFPLPTVGPQLDAFATAIHSGRGFCVLRGLDPKQYSIEDNTLLFLGLSSYIGAKRGAQDGRGSMITHISHPVTKERRESAFRSENYCDILAFHIRSERNEVFRLASSWHIYNRLRETTPKKLDEFANVPKEPQRPKNPHGSSNYSAQLFLHKKRIILSFPEHTDREQQLLVPGHSHATTAMDPQSLSHWISTTAEESCVTLHLQEGDFLFLNNWAILHSIDDLETPTDERRHLVKLWLRNDELAWDLPPALAESTRRVFDKEVFNHVWELWPRVRNPAVQTVMHMRVVSSSKISVTRQPSIGSISAGRASLEGESLDSNGVDRGERLDG